MELYLHSPHVFMEVRSHELFVSYAPCVVFAVVGCSLEWRAHCRLDAAYINHSSVLRVALSRADLRVIFSSHVALFTADAWCGELKWLFIGWNNNWEIAKCAVTCCANLAEGVAYKIRGLCMWYLNLLNYTTLVQRKRENWTKRRSKKRRVDIYIYIYIYIHTHTQGYCKRNRHFQCCIETKLLMI
jgi:hypothetical protein